MAAGNLSRGISGGDGCRMRRKRNATAATTATGARFYD
jgi:hypothetical protein